MSEALERYGRWLSDPLIDDSTKAELRAIDGQTADIEDRFYRDLEFGTGGLRGVIGAGTNRINVYTVGRATEGFARYIVERATAQGREPSVVIAHDSRRMSPEFAEQAALVMAGNGVKAYVFESLRTTPELSFAVRHYGADGGIVITASHNPPEYNGYKVYGDDGCQLVPDLAEQVIQRIQQVGSLAEVKRLDRDEAERLGLFATIGAEADQAYLVAVTAATPGGEAARRAAADLRIVYTPLHGAGNVAVRAALQAAGFAHVAVVAEQELPDGQFPTVASPNPEERAAFALALELADRTDADIVIGTDPDCDRMGAVVKNRDGQYEVLTGNQSGAIMIHYLLDRMQQLGRLPSNGVVIKTIVTSEMGGDIARSYGMRVMNTLTGFKYIGEQMTLFERSGGDAQFVFGYEESYGYLAGTYARDKDAVLAALLICEAAAYYKSRNQTLYDVLHSLYERHGYYLESLESRTMKGKDGMAAMNAIMQQWREAAPASVAGVDVAELLDYANGLDGLPKENVLKFKLADGSWFCLRPSGTEPKIKVYFAVCGSSLQDSAARLEKLAAAVMRKID